MSKKAVYRALRALEAGAEPADIDEILSGVTATFLRRRLRSLIDSGDSDSAPAQRLWTAKFGDSRPVPSTRDTKAEAPVVRPPLQGAPEGAAPEPAGGESPPTSVRLDDPTPLLSWMARNHSGGYPGTLVAFELPNDSVENYDDLIHTIQGRARARTPKRAQHHWIRYGRSPADARSFVVQYTSENTEQAEKFAREHLEPRILRKEAIVLDFLGMEIATQSYLHALLYDALRLAWAKQSFIYVVNASPSVRSGIELIEAYALGG